MVVVGHGGENMTWCKLVGVLVFCAAGHTTSCGYGFVLEKYHSGP